MIVAGIVASASIFIERVLFAGFLIIFVALSFPFLEVVGRLAGFQFDGWGVVLVAVHYGSRFRAESQFVSTTIAIFLGDHLCHLIGKGRRLSIMYDF